jgi:hypothetical protein
MEEGARAIRVSSAAMLKATASGPGGTLVFLGLSFENLRRLRGGESIQFQAAEVGLGEGLFVLVHADDPFRAVVEQELAHSVSVAIVLHDSNHDDLRAGLALDLDLGAFRPGLRSLVFAAKDEDALVRLLADQGLVGASTAIDDPHALVSPATKGLPRRPTSSLFDYVPVAAAALGAFACFYGAIERRHDPLLYVLGGILMAFAIGSAIRLR